MSDNSTSGCAGCFGALVAAALLGTGAYWLKKNGLPEWAKPSSIVEATAAAPTPAPTAAVPTPATADNTPLRPSLDAVASEMDMWLAHLKKSFQNLSQPGDGSLAQRLRNFQAQKLGPELNLFPPRLAKLRVRHQELAARLKTQTARLTPEGGKLGQSLLHSLGQELEGRETNLKAWQTASRSLDERISALIVFHDQSRNINGTQKAEEQLRAELAKLRLDFPE